MGTLSDGQMQSKPAIKSKINWLGLAQVATASATYVLGAIDAKVAIPAIIWGALVVAVRTFGTTKPVAGIVNEK